MKIESKFFRVVALPRIRQDEEQTPRKKKDDSWRAVDKDAVDTQHSVVYKPMTLVLFFEDDQDTRRLIKATVHKFGQAEFVQSKPSHRIHLSSTYPTGFSIFHLPQPQSLTFDGPQVGVSPWFLRTLIISWFTSIETGQEILSLKTFLVTGQGVFCSSGYVSRR